MRLPLADLIGNAEDALRRPTPQEESPVEEIGWIEIGQHEMISAFVRAYDLGGTVYEGEDSYPSMEAAFQALEAGIKAYLDDNGI